MTLGDIIKEYRTKTGMTMDHFAVKSDLSKGYISMLEKGVHPRNNKPIVPSIQTIEKVAIALGQSFDAVFNALDDTQEIFVRKKSDDEDTISLSKIAEPVLYSKRIPILGRIAAGVPILCDEYLEGYEPVDDDRIDYALRVKGDSMFSTIQPGSLIYVDQDGEITNGSIVVALINGDDATVKRFYKYSDDEIVLRADNPNYGERTYSAKDVMILGKVRKSVNCFD
ncbi:MAG: XRE family transcriptional regulator [Clostridiales Family XIII bacterium]|jgi:repressor LexA|nr:XRE family transcriptional regulator [Clostridiales Family XIII bacterium]